jgi:hypothetical protein
MTDHCCQLSAIWNWHAALTQCLLLACYATLSAAMELATELVQQAVYADPDGDNIKAQLSHVAYTLATATTPQQQLAALEQAENIVRQSSSRFVLSSYVHHSAVLDTRSRPS